MCEAQLNELTMPHIIAYSFVFAQWQHDIYSANHVDANISCQAQYFNLIELTSKFIPMEGLNGKTVSRVPMRLQTKYTIHDKTN